MRRKKTYSQASRVQGILRTLGTRQGITIGELAEEFSITKRTLYRDLKALEEAGYPLVSDIVEGTTLDLKDGRILLSMAASGKEEIKVWILSFGPKAEVLSPKFLKEEIKEDISETLAFYRS